MATIPHHAYNRQYCTVCFCSQCATINPVTGRTEGLLIPTTTAYRHAADDRLARSFRLPDLPNSPSTLAASQPPPERNVRSDHTEQIQSLHQEIAERLATLELSGELRFLHNPSDAGVYDSEHPDNMGVAANVGGTTLKYGSHAQSTRLIEQESRFSEIILQLQQMQEREPLDENEELQERLLNALDEIDRYKSVEWSRQRSRSYTSSEGHPVIDTGKLFIIFAISVYSQPECRMLFPKLSTSEPKTKSTFPHRVDDERATTHH